MARRLPAATAQVDPEIHTLAGLGAVVRNKRAQAQLRVDDAALASGASADTLSRLENGRPVTSDKLMALLSGLGLSMLVVDSVQASRIKAALVDLPKADHG
ncbi:MAG: helix-turn-helix domain-containing protein [Proteobacteria bacterium]|nr:helix-turn-helix domain-containing protein [Pseudomonadota bacterium]